MYKFNLETNKEGLYNITEQVNEAIKESGINDGICVVYCPHTTAGITINENADEFVGKDIILGIKNAFPKLEEFRHDEGNSTGHIKSSLFGASETIIIDKGKMVLGTWQNVYFAEFDPPRKRNFYVKIL